jgi:hypothetical protein
MHRRLSALVLTASLATLFAALPAGGAAASSQTRWVDDDGRAGPGGCGSTRTAARHIQTAVNASGPGDAVVVCPGTYVEQVRIRGDRDGLTLRAAESFAAQIKSPRHLEAPYGFRYLVLVDRVDDVTVRGFRVVTRTSGPCEPVDGAMVAVRSQGTSFRGNRLQAPGTRTGDCYQGVGIAILDSFTPTGASSFTATATIAANEVRDAVYIGIAAVGQSGRVRLDVAGNTVRAWFGAPPVGPAPGVLDVVSQFGIALLGRVAGTVRGNVVQGAIGAPEAAPGFYYGIAVSPTTCLCAGSDRNGAIDIRGNLVRRVWYGVMLIGAHHVKVRGNEVRRVLVGVGLQDTRDSRVVNNEVRGAQGGIWVGGDSHANRLADNVVAGAGGSCQDGTSGGRTAGTANTWTGNTAKHGDSPSGICPAA